MDKLQALAIALSTLLIQALMTSCATNPNWKQQHYDTANKGAMCQVICSTGQLEAARNNGCNCNANTSHLRSNSTSNGNTSIINVNPSHSYSRSSDPYQNFGAIFQNLYNQERQNRMHSDMIYNGIPKMR